MILLSQIDLGIRARSTLSGIAELAEDIKEKGLISPILLTKKTTSLISEYESFHQTVLNISQPYLLTCGGRRLAALTSLGINLLHPGTSCDVARPGYLLRETSSLLDLLLIEGRENRNRQDLDWRDDMKLIVSAYRLARKQANSEGEYLVMKDFASLLGVSHTHLGIAEKVYDDYLSDPDAYKEAQSIYAALSISIKKVGNVATKVLLHRQLNEKPIIREVKPDGGDSTPLPDKGGDIIERATVPSPQPDSGIAEVPSSPITIPLSLAFFNLDFNIFMSSQPSGFCDHIVTQVTSDIDKEYFLNLAWSALPEQGYLALFVRHFEPWMKAIRDTKFLLQSHPLIWNKIDYRNPILGGDNENFSQSYETCLLARKPGSILAQRQNSSTYTCSHIRHLDRYGPNYIPNEVYSWIVKAIAVPGQVIYDPFARTGASAIGTINVKCRPLGTESNPKNFQKLLTNLKEYYTRQIPNVQFT